MTEVRHPLARAQELKGFACDLADWFSVD